MRFSVSIRSILMMTLVCVAVVGLVWFLRPPEGSADEGNASHPEAQGSMTKQEETMESMHAEEMPHEMEHEEEEGSLHEVMESLLETTQAMLGALTEEHEEEEVAEYTEKLIHLGELTQQTGEDQAAPDPYGFYASQLLRHARALRKHADERDMEGATLRLGQVQLTCVMCHAQVRR